MKGAPGAGSTSSAAAEAFDAIASEYDQVLAPVANPLVPLIRERVHRVMARLFTAGSALLEIGCGTGEDTLALTARGHRIVATDVSPRMIDAARVKLASAGRSDAVTFVAKGAADLGESWPSLGLEVDGVFSNFAPLNCELSLAPVRLLLERCLSPGGVFVGVVLPRVCPLEVLLFLARGEPKTALRRFRKDAVADVEGLRFPMRYYGAADFDRALGPGFQRIDTRSLGLVLPPLSFGAAFARRPRLLRALGWLDERVSGLPALRLVGDHILVGYRRT